ncbi:hypothetical protein B0H66DRAFT_39830 [Apodospora peruviana]|uniref:Uncharacterized protein n=1 Tax=Apodospora peruviana TaxID=516989 RepID=A0AAE0IRT8_9PEZI|nr:hypothetical protein B0H66DRAFT_39830 [Apodospora peruviana]
MIDIAVYRLAGQFLPLHVPGAAVRKSTEMDGSLAYLPVTEPGVALPDFRLTRYMTLTDETLQLCSVAITAAISEHPTWRNQSEQTPALMHDAHCGGVGVCCRTFWPAVALETRVRSSSSSWLGIWRGRRQFSVFAMIMTPHDSSTWTGGFSGARESLPEAPPIARNSGTIPAGMRATSGLLFLDQVCLTLGEAPAAVPLLVFGY